MKGLNVITVLIFVAFAAAGTMMDREFQIESQLEKKEVRNCLLEQTNISWRRYS